MLAERVIFLPALPELFLAAAAMVLLLVGVFRGDGAARTVSWLAVGVLAVTGLLAGVLGTRADTALLGLFVTDAFAVLMKLLVLLGSFIAVIMAMDFNERERMARPEYPVLVLFATLGMMMMISANDLMSLYLGLELQSLSLYVLAAFQRDSVRSTEAGLKYFVLGALSSGMLLYGASLLYGFTGTTSFADIGDVLAGSVGEVPLGALFGLVFVTAGLAFKVSAAPFHMWTPDVYEGAPTPVTAFFAAAPKIAATALLVRVLVTPLGPLAAQWQQIVVAAAVLSMAVGALAAINQTNIKRLMAYSSIGHIGFALIGLAAGDEVGVRGLIMYMAIYLVMNVAAFGVILCMRRQDRMVERIDDLAGLGRTRPMLALAMLVAMFSMAGIPPLAGFFGKLYVFNAAIQAGLYALAVFGVLASVVSAFYYLRVVKVMYFDEPLESFDRGVGRPMAAILVGATTFMVTFILLPLAVNIEGWVGSAAASLFPG